MDDPLLVRRLEPRRNLTGDRQRFLDVEGPLSQHLEQRLAVDQLLDQIAGLSLLIEIVDRGQVRVVQRGEQHRLLVEALQLHGIRGEVLGEDLDGDFAVELLVVGAIDLAHPPLADLRLYLVRAEGLADQGLRLRFAPGPEGRPSTLGPGQKRTLPRERLGYNGARFQPLYPASGSLVYRRCSATGRAGRRSLRLSVSTKIEKPIAK